MVKQLLGIKPFSFQKDVINETINAKGTGKTIVVKSRRQVGKSVLISNLLLYYAINFTGTKNYCLTPTLKQGKKIYKGIVNAISTSKIIKSKNATELIITLINGSTINFKSAEQRESLRGETCTGILCIDEAAYIPDDIFNIVKPWCDFHKAVTLIVSTPFIKSGFFYQYYNYGLDNQYNTVTIDWCDEKYLFDLNTILPPETLEQYKQVLPSNVFKTEYLGLFLDDEGTVFINLKSALKYVKINPTDDLYVGIDFSNQGEDDDTVISIFNGKGQQVFLKYFNNLSPLRQIDVIVKELEPYAKQIKVISSELNSIGTPYTDLIKERSQILSNKVQGFQTSNTSKNAIVLNMQTALEKGEATLLDDEKQTRQFSYFTATYNPKTRNVSYAAPQGLHDDCVMATLIAYDAYKNGLRTGEYNFAFKQKINKHKENKTKYGISKA